MRREKATTCVLRCIGVWRTHSVASIHSHPKKTSLLAEWRAGCCCCLLCYCCCSFFLSFFFLLPSLSSIASSNVYNRPTSQSLRWFVSWWTWGVVNSFFCFVLLFCRLRCRYSNHLTKKKRKNTQKKLTQKENGINNREKKKSKIVIKSREFRQGKYTDTSGLVCVRRTISYTFDFPPRHS